MVDYLNELRDACLEAYTGIIQGLRGPDAKNISGKFVIIIIVVHDRDRMEISKIPNRMHETN